MPPSFSLDNQPRNRYISQVQNFEKANNLPTPDEEEMVSLLEAAPLVMRAMRAEISRHRPGGLSLPQFRALAFVHHHDGVSLSDIAEHLGMLPSSTTRMIDQLTNRRLVIRQECQHDRRRVTLTLTAQGIQVYEEAQRMGVAWLSQHLSGLSPHEHHIVRQAADILRKVFAVE